MDIETSMPTEKADLEKLQNRVLKQAGLGLRLKAAREATRLSEKDAALRLHLSPRMIEIMENEDFDNGPPATFMRGYLRSYARILNIPEEEINAAVAHLESNLPQTPQPAAPPILNTRSMNENHQHLRRMTYLVIALLVVLVTMWWVSHPKDTIIFNKSAAPAMTNQATTTVAPVAAPTPETAAPTAELPNTSAAPNTTFNSPTTTDGTAPAPTTPAMAPEATAPTAPPAPDAQANTAAQPQPPTASAPTLPATPASPISPPAATSAPGVPASPMTAPNQSDTPVNVDDLNMARPEPGLDDDSDY